MAGRIDTQRQADRSRSLKAWLLLLVFVPMLVLSAIHVHESQDTPVCDECAHHVSHASHITVAGCQSFSCVLCQFISLTYFTAMATSMVFISGCNRVPHLLPVRPVQSCTILTNPLRGPPYRLSV